VTLEGARLAWKLLSGRDGIERRYWKQDEGGRWKQQA
jgi:DNA polymerase-3 subunit chi